MSASSPAVPAELTRSILLGSKLERPSAEQLSEAVSPSGDGTSWTVASASVGDARRALTIAYDVQPSWAQSGLEARQAIVGRIADLLERDLESLARIIVAETGKTITHARGEVHAAVTSSRALAAISPDALASRTDHGADVSVRVRHVPLGPALLITPWNFPLSLAVRKVCSAVLAGCAIILKPSERAPITGLALGTIAAEAGLPSGVLSVIPSFESAAVVAALCDDHRLRKISFTGSTAVGRKVLQASTQQFQRVQLELGGNAPAILCADADVERSLVSIWQAKLFNTGQACVAPNRLLVHERLLDEVETTLADMVGATVVGNPWDERVDIGPLIDQHSYSRLENLVQGGHGGRVIRSPQSDPGKHRLAPVIVVGPRPDAAVCREELFGPVLSVRTFTESEEAVVEANNTEYGLAAYVFGQQEAREVAGRLDVGMVGVNRAAVSYPATPFGGTKHSGLGRENGIAGIRAYCETRAVVGDVCE